MKKKPIKSKNESFLVGPEYSGKTVAAFLKAMVQDLSWKQVRSLIAQGKVRIRKRIVNDDVVRLSDGETVSIIHTDKAITQEKSMRDGIQIVYLDNDIVVVDKPSGITTVRHACEVEEFGEKAYFLPETVARLVPKIIAKRGRKKTRSSSFPPVRAVHRLDKDTSGLVVFARTAKAATALGKQFKEHSIKRMYQAIVVGAMKPQRIKTHLVRDRGDGIRGNGDNGKVAITHVALVEKLPRHTLIACRLETGRTHQIRIHCAEKGHMICGDKIYYKRFKRKNFIDQSNSPRLALHAGLLGFIHPTLKVYKEFSSPLPDELQSFLKQLKHTTI